MKIYTRGQKRKFRLLVTKKSTFKDNFGQHCEF